MRPLLTTLSDWCRVDVEIEQAVWQSASIPSDSASLAYLCGLSKLILCVAGHLAVLWRHDYTKQGPLNSTAV